MHINRIQVVSICLGILVLTGMSTAMMQEHITADSIDFKTLHRNWAIPLSDGSVRVLAFVSGAIRGWKDGAYTQTFGRVRDVIELAQRSDFDMDLVIIQAATRGFAVASKEGKEQQAKSRMEQLICGDNRYDVILLADVKFSSLGKNVQQAIAKRVRCGAGLVCVQYRPDISGYGNNSYTNNSVKLGDIFDCFYLSETGLSAELKLYSYGKGRIAVIKYPEGALTVTPYMEYSMENKAKYEYWSAWVCKVLLWAAKRQRNIRITANDEKRSFTLVNETQSSCDLNVSITVKNDIGEIQSSKNYKITLGSKESRTLKVKTDDIGNGLFYADVIASNQNGKQGFGAFAFRENKYPHVRTIKIGHQAVEVNEPFNAIVIYEFVKNSILRVDVVTADNRVIVRREFPIQKSESQLLSLKITPAMCPTIAMRIRAESVQGGKILSHTYVPFTVTMRNQGKFNFITWGKSNDILCYYAFEKLRSAGFDGCVIGGDPTAAMSANNISQILYLTRIIAEKDNSGCLIPYSWYDNEAIRRYLKTLLLSAKKSIQHGVMFYSLGDEPAYAAIDNSATTQKAFREYLKKRYGTIENLNMIWKSSYKDFDCVPVPIKDYKAEENPEENKTKRGSHEHVNIADLPKWYDRELFMRKSFVNICRQFKPLAKSVDAKARIGFEGAGRMHQGPLINELIAVNDFWVTYYDQLFNVVRESTKPSEFHCSRWIGYQPAKLVGYSWLNTIMGANGVWFWRWDGIGARQGLLQPDFEFYPESQACIDEWKILREGLGDWLIRASYADDGIRILHSHESWGASHCRGVSKLGRYDWGQGAFMKLFWNLGLGFRYISPAQIKNGTMKNDKIKLLVLSKQYALDDETMNGIKRFVAEGGAVIADVLPGQFDQYCRLRKKSAMQELFGVSHAGYDFASIRLRATIRGRVLDNRTVVDKGTRVKTGRCIRLENGGEPVWIEHNFGKGITLLLNFRIDSYPVTKYVRYPEEFLDLMSDYFERAQISMPFKITAGKKHLRSKLIAARWKLGDVTLIGLLGDGKAERVKVSLSEKAIITPLLSNRRRVTDTFEADLPGQCARFWIISDGVFNFDIKGPSTVRIGKPANYVIVSKSKKKYQPFYVYLKTADGRIPNWSRKVLLTDKGKAEYVFVPPFNVSVNQWKICVKSTFTGVVKEMEIEE